MSDEARLKLVIEGFEKADEMLAQLERRLQSLSGAGGGMALPGGQGAIVGQLANQGAGINVASTAAAATPGGPPAVSLSATASVAGTGAIASATAQAMSGGPGFSMDDFFARFEQSLQSIVQRGPGGGGAGGGQAGGPPGGMADMFFGRMAQFGVGYFGVNQIGSMMGQQYAYQAAGQPFQAEAAMKTSAWGVGAAALGLGVSFLPIPGAPLIGLGISAAGQAVGSAMGPRYQYEATASGVSEMLGNMGFGHYSPGYLAEFPAPVLSAMQSSAMRGIPINPDRMAIDDFPASLRGPAADLLSRAIGSREYVRRYGFTGGPDLRIAEGPDGRQGRRGQAELDAMLESFWYEDPYGAAALAGMQTRYGAGESRRLGSEALQIRTRELLQAEDDSLVAGARYSAAEADFGIGLRRRGYGFASGSGVPAARRRSFAEARRLAGIRLPPAQLEAELLKLDASERAADAAYDDAVFGAFTEDVSGRTDLFTQRAEQAFQRALYSGTGARGLPWDRQFQGVEEQIAANDALFSADPNRNNPAVGRRYQMRRESLEFRRDQVIPRMAEEAIARSDMQMTQMGAQAAFNAVTPGLMRGSLLEQTAGMIGAQGAQMSAVRDELQRQLETRRMLTEEQRNAMTLQKLQLDMAIQQTQIQAAAAGIQATLQTGLARTQHGTTSSRLALISGEGGTVHLDALYGAAGANVSHFQTALSTTLAQFGADSAQAQGARAGLDQALLAQAQADVSRAIPLMAGSERARRIDLSAMLQFARAGYVPGRGMGRSIIREQLDMNDRRLSALNARRDELVASGEWNGAMQEQFSAERADLALQSLGLQQQYDEGWIDRLVSESYNMPASGRLMMTQFTHREATLFGGVFNRAFGGTKAQVDRARFEAPARFLRMIGMDNPEGMAESGLRRAERVDVEVNVKVNAEDARTGKPLESSQEVLRHSNTIRRHTQPPSRPSS